MEKISIVFDTETTGLIKPSVLDIKEQPQIIELYAMKILHRNDGSLEQIDEFETYLKPILPIEAFITKITGIDNNMVAKAPEFSQIFPALAKFHVGAHEWVAHNCAFDAAMVANEISRIGKIIHFPFPPVHVCTVQKTMQFEQRRLNLTRLHEYLFGTGFADAHRAKGDVQALYRCYEELVSRGVIK
jgi:DNA polymerase III subunit epsilon